MTTEYKNDTIPRFDLDDSIEEGKGEESDDEDEVLGDYENIEGKYLNTLLPRATVGALV